eukprot:NODE_481_length_6950_cov_0.533353.p7 type:complete len:139 gc:universal NODE_481_length_6950_cov_0.533353:2883-2467(-)
MVLFHFWIEMSAIVFTLIMVIIYAVFPIPYFHYFILSIWGGIGMIILLVVLHQFYPINGNYFKIKRRIHRYKLMKDLEARRKTYDPTINLMDEVCAICMEALESTYEITKCLHLYHESCLDMWTQDSCPTCRLEKYRN